MCTVGIDRARMIHTHCWEVAVLSISLSVLRSSVLLSLYPIVLPLFSMLFHISVTEHYLSVPCLSFFPYFSVSFSQLISICSFSILWAFVYCSLYTLVRKYCPRFIIHSFCMTDIIWGAFASFGNTKIIISVCLSVCTHVNNYRIVNFS
jgi:hypothetical protein